MDNDKKALATSELTTLPLNHNWYQKLASNFEIIQPYLDKLNTDDLDDISDKINIYEDNMQAIVNILAKYDVPIQIVNGKVVETEEGE
ncbi:hypothetical protein GA516_04675 [Lactobacillus pentosus]|uniref:hypothetical protein n=1 Tax=Lactiplantibacillus pentosus TaxID=1589 RepID=UPI00128C3546|nr:hypothetical protein [Lactiplantibacillus pentosus]MPQ18646.1 hypothetical protein [Lactiplantibacillus pentosus]